MRLLRRISASRMTVLSCAILSALLGASARGQQPVGPGIAVEQAWARASAGTTGAAYLSIANRGTSRDRLIAVTTPVAGKAELHEDSMENGIMRMRPIGPITIEPGQSVVLKPGADHVMLIGLKQPLRKGESFPLTLSFEKAGDVLVTVRIEGAGAMGASVGDRHPMRDMRDDGVGGMK